MSHSLKQLFATLLIMLMLSHSAQAQNGVPALLPFQGRVTDSTGSPINYPVDIKFRIYPPAGTCYIYEETHHVVPNAFGIFSVMLGAGVRTGPANNLIKAFNNDTAGLVIDSCGANYIPAANEWRRLEMVVDGTPVAGMQTIGASAFSMNSQMLEGRSAQDFIQKNASVNQANMVTLTDGSEASSLHNHDSLYAKIDGSNAFSGNVSTTGSIYSTSPTGSIGVGTNSTAADIHVKKDAPTIRLESTSGFGGNAAIDFYGGATKRGRIEATENSNGLKLYSGNTLAVTIDSGGNLIVANSMKTAGTFGLGQYTTAQETALLTSLGALGASAKGTMWANSTTGELRYWDGSAGQTVWNKTSSGVAAGSYGTDAAVPTITVDLLGRITSATNTPISLPLAQIKQGGATSGQVLKWNGTVWAPAAESGITVETDPNVPAWAKAAPAARLTTTGSVLDLAASGVTAATYGSATQVPVVAVDAFGRVTSVTNTTITGTSPVGSALNSGQIWVGSSGNQAAAVAVSGDIALTNAGATTVGKIRGQTLAGNSASPGSILTYNSTFAQWEAQTLPSCSTSQTLNFNSITGAFSCGVINNATNFTGSLAGDITGTQGATSLAKIQTRALTITSVTDRDVLQYNGTDWVNRNIPACSANQYLTFNGTTYACATDVGSAGNVSSLAATAPLAVSASTGAVNVSVAYDNATIGINGSNQLEVKDGVDRSSAQTIAGAKTFSGGLIHNSTGATQIAAGTTAQQPGAPTAGMIRINTSNGNKPEYWNGSAWTVVGSGLAVTSVGVSVPSYMTSSNGPITSSGTIALDFQTQTAKTVFAGPTSGGAAAPSFRTLDAGDISTGTLPIARGGTGSATALTNNKVMTSSGGGIVEGNGFGSAKANNTFVTRDGSGGFAAGAVTADSIVLPGSTSGTVTLQGASTTTPYTLTFPATAGAAGQVLTTDVLGNLSWTTPNTGFVTSVTSGNSYVSVASSTTTPVITANVGTSANTLAAGDDARIVGALQKAGGTMTGSLSMSANTNILMGQYATDPAGLVAADKGRVWYNTVEGKLKYWDGSAAVALGVAGSGVQTFNGSTVNTQTFTTPGTAGTAPDWSTNTGTGAHTLNVPLASAAGVTAGLISKTDYDSFAAKLGTGTSFTGDISGNYNSTSVDKVKGTAVTITSLTTGNTLKYNGTAWVNSALDTSDLATGMLSVARGGTGSASFSADRMVIGNVTGTGLISFACTAGNTLSFSATGAATCEAVNGASQLVRLNGSADLAAPGNITLAASKYLGFGQYGADPDTTLWGTPEKGRAWFNTSTNTLKYWDGGSVVAVGVSGSGMQSLNGSSITAQTFAAPGTSGTAPAWVTNAGTGVHTLNVPMASASGVTAGLLAKTDYDAFTAKLGTSTSFSGDISGNYNSTSVDKIKGTAVSIASLANKNFLKYNGSNWVNSFITAADLAGSATDGYVLTADSGETTGVRWSAITSGTVTNVAAGTGLNVGAGPGGSISSTGTLNIDVGTTANKIVQLTAAAKYPAVDGSLITNLAAGNLTGTVAIANGGTGQSSKTAAFDALSPTTTKGDLAVFNGTNNIRLPAGTDNYVLQADSTQASGLKWSALPSAPGDSSYVAKGLVQFDSDAATSGVSVTAGVANVNTGTGANQIVKLDASSKLPAVDGSALTNLNAGNISSGTLPIARGGTNSGTALTNGKVMVSSGGAIVEGNASNTAKSNNTFVMRDGSGNIAGALGTFDQLAVNGTTTGTVNVYAPASFTSWNLTLPANAGTNGYVLATNGSGVTSWVPAGGTGTVTNITAGTGLNVGAGPGGSITSTGTLNIDAGTGANQIVQLTAAAKYPAVDGSLITNLDPTNLSAAVPIANGGTGQTTKTAAFDALSPATTKGDLAVFNGTNNIRLPAGTNNYVLQADSTQASGLKWSALPSAPGDASYAAKGLVQFDTDAATSGVSVTAGVASINTGTAANQLVKLDGSAKLPAVDGSALTNLSAGSIATGTLPVARGGTNSGTALNNNRMMVSSGGAIVESAAMTNGQMLIGSTGAAPVVGTITGSNGVLVTTGAGTLALSTNAVSTNTASTIVTRDASGNFAAGAITNESNALKGSTSGTLTMQVPATVTSYTLTWPNAVGGAGSFLTTDASGNLSWGSPAAIADSSYAAKGAVQFLTDAATSGITIASGVANVNTGTGANQIVKLDGTAKLPAVDGSALTNLNAANIATGTLPIARGGTNSGTALTNGKVMVSSAGAIVEGNASNTAKSNNTFVMRDGSGNIAGALGTFDQLAINGSTAGTLNIYAPASFTSWSLTLPTTAGTNGYVLATNGSGVTSWVAPGGSGTVTSITAGTGLNVGAGPGGNITSTGTLNIDAGTGANQIVQLTAAAKYPAVDGSLITNLSPANLSTAVPIANGGTGQTTKTAAFDALSPNTTKGDIAVNNGTNNVRLPAGADNFVLTADSSQPSGLKWAAAVSTPADSSYSTKGIVQFLTDAATSGITIASGVANVNTGTGANQIVKLDASSKLPAVDGSSLTNLDAANIATGILPIARGGTNSGAALTNGKVMVSSSGAIVEGVASATAKTASTFVMRDGSGNIAGALGTFDQLSMNGSVSGAIQVAAPSTTANYTFTLPNSAGTNGYVLATNGSGTTSWVAQSGGVAGSGTSGQIPKLTASSTIADSIITESGGNIGIGTTTPSSLLSLGGTAARTISMERNATAGQSLTISSGGANLGGTDLAGGDLNLQSGIATGTGASNIYLKTATAQTTGTTDNAPTTKMTILGSGNVGIGTTTPSQSLEVVGSVKAVGYYSTSDARLKTNVRPISGLDIITRLKGVRYNWISNGQADFGVIAQQVEAVLPEAVVTDPVSGYKSVKYQNLVSPLIEATKELNYRCEATEKATRKLASENEELKQQVQKLQQQNNNLEQRLQAIEKALRTK